MRKITSIASIVFLIQAFVSLDVFAQSWAEAMFQERRHDFGSVAIGVEAVHRFQLKNEYTEDVHIAAVHSSCGCTSPSVTKAWLRAGETSEIVAKLNTDGRFEKNKSATLTVVFDKPRLAEVQLQVTSYIRPDVVITPGMVEFGSVPEGKQASKKLIMQYAGRSDWQLIKIERNNPAVHIRADEVERGNGRVTYEITVTLQDQIRPGYVHDMVRFITNDPNPDASSVMLPVHGYVTAPLIAKPSPFTVGFLKPGESVTKNIVLRSATPFRITRVTSVDRRFSFSVSEQENRVHVVPITFTANAKMGELTEPIVLQTNLDAQHEIIVLTQGKILPKHMQNYPNEMIAEKTTSSPSVRKNDRKNDTPVTTDTNADDVDVPNIGRTATVREKEVLSERKKPQAATQDTEIIFEEPSKINANEHILNNVLNNDSSIAKPAQKGDSESEWSTTKNLASSHDMTPPSDNPDNITVTFGSNLDAEVAKKETSNGFNVAMVPDQNATIVRDHTNEVHATSQNETLTVLPNTQTEIFSPETLDPKSPVTLPQTSQQALSQASTQTPQQIPPQALAQALPRTMSHPNQTMRHNAQPQSELQANENGEIADVFVDVTPTNSAKQPGQQNMSSAPGSLLSRSSANTANSTTPAQKAAAAATTTVAMAATTTTTMPTTTRPTATTNELFYEVAPDSVGNEQKPESKKLKFSTPTLQADPFEQPQDQTHAYDTEVFTVVDEQNARQTSAYQTSNALISSTNGVSSSTRTNSVSANNVSPQSGNQVPLIAMIPPVPGMRHVPNVRANVPQNEMQMTQKNEVQTAPKNEMPTLLASVSKNANDLIASLTGDDVGKISPSANILANDNGHHDLPETLQSLPRLQNTLSENTLPREIVASDDSEGEIIDGKFADAETLNQPEIVSKYPDVLQNENGTAAQTVPQLSTSLPQSRQTSQLPLRKLPPSSLPSQALTRGMSDQPQTVMAPVVAQGQSDGVVLPEKPLRPPVVQNFSNAPNVVPAQSQSQAQSQTPRVMTPQSLSGTGRPPVARQQQTLQQPSGAYASPSQMLQQQSRMTNTQQTQTAVPTSAPNWQQYAAQQPANAAPNMAQNDAQRVVPPAPNMQSRQPQYLR